MGYDLRRAALACLSVLAVVFAASQFPAAGVGDFPGGVGGDTGGIGGPTPVDGGAPGGETPVDRDSTATKTPSGTTTDDDTAPGTGATETATATATATETTTETATPEDDAVRSEEDDDLLGGVLFAVFGIPVFLAGVLGFGTMIGVVGFRRTGPGGRLVMRIAGSEIDVGGGLQGLSKASMSAVLGLSSSSARLVSGLGDALGGLAGSLTLLGSGSGRALTSLPAALGRGIGTVGSGLGKAAIAVPSGLGSMLSGIGSFSLGWSDGSTPSEDARSLGDTETASGDDGDDQRPPPETVEDVWERFVETVPVRNSRARTPGEYARMAVGSGLPADPVGRLTRTFREIRYGERPPDEERFERARSAWSRIRSHATEEDEQ